MIANRTLLAVAITAASALAADSSTTVSILYPDFTSQSLVGSVIDAVPEATTYAFSCPTDAPKKICILSKPQTLVQGPSTYSVVYDYDANVRDIFNMKATAACKLNPSKNTASCVMSAFFSATGSVSQTTTSTIIRSYLASQAPLVVTAGLEKLSAKAGSGSGATTAAPSATSAASASGSSSRSSTASATAPAQSSNAASPILAQNAMLVAVAAVAGGAMAL